MKVQAKLKEVKRKLLKWSKEVFGNFIHQIVTFEDIIRVKEIQLEMQPTDVNRAEAQPKKFLKIEEEYGNCYASYFFYT